MRSDLQTHLKRMGGPVVNIRGAAAAETIEADKGDDIVVNKDDSKQAKPKPKQSTHHSKKKRKDSSKRIEPLYDNLNEYFGLSQSHNSQETADVTPVTLKRSEEAKSKNDPDGSSCRGVDKSSKPSSKSKQLVQNSADSSHRKVHKSPCSSAGEGSSESSSKSKQAAQQTMKPESEDSSSLSSSSSDSESLDEEVPSKGKMKELSPPPLLKKRDRSQSLLHSRGKCSKSQSRSHTLK